LNSVQETCTAFLPLMAKHKKTAAKPHKTASKDKWLGSDSEQAQRLRVIQTLARKLIDAEFAKFIGISRPRLSNLFNGAPIGKDVAFRIRQKLPSLSLEYIWFGEKDRLSNQTILELADAEERWSDTTPSR
jgi:hypothetical protein